MENLKNSQTLPCPEKVFGMPLSPQEIWKRTQADLELSLSRSMHSVWIKPTDLVGLREIGENRLIVTITATSSYHLSMLESRFYAHIQEALNRVTNKQCELEFQHPQQKKSPPQQESTPNTLFSDFQQDQNTQGSSTSQHQDFSQPAETSSARSLIEESTAVHLSQESSSSTAQNFSSTAPTRQQPQQATSFPEYSPYKLAVRRSGLHEDRTFDTFAVSTSNEMAHAAAVAVSQSPGSAYNPLFLYGGVGVGKTHLMQAIGHNVLRQNPEISLAYITGEQFTNDIVAAIQQKKTIQLKQRFRAYKVLLMDDIQFIAGKDSVQEEFFHTFNAIVPNGGQVILTSDRPPHEMDLLEDRLRSRFEAGLIIDIQSPSFELRTAIILIKARKLGMELPMELAQKIAAGAESTRKLEGILAKLHSELTLFRKPLSSELIESILGKTQPVEFPSQKIKPADVIKILSAQFHISTNSLKGPSRTKDLVHARHMAMYILYEDLRVTLEDIGMLFGGRDHTSVLHAVQKMKTRVLEDELVRTQLAAIKTSLSANS